MLYAIHHFLFKSSPSPRQRDAPKVTMPADQPKSKMIKWSDGTVYVGDFRAQRMEGTGRLTFPNKDFYEGQFQNNNFHGRGLYSGKDGVYEGEWQNGLKNGEGKQKGSDGSTFVGKYANGLKEGFGLFEWSDGSFYQGMFKQDFMHGQGKMKYANGVVLQGEWIENELNGVGRQTDSGGRVYCGNFRKGVKHGAGLLLQKNRKIEGFWQNGNLVAAVLIQDNDGICLNISFQDGLFKLLSDSQFQQLRQSQGQLEVHE